MLVFVLVLCILLWTCRLPSVCSVAAEEQERVLRFASLLAISYCPFATPGSPSPGAIDGAFRACKVVPTGKTGLPEAASNISALAVYQAQIAETINV
jgi:hypothetical protein